MVFILPAALQIQRMGTAQAKGEKKEVWYPLFAYTGCIAVRDGSGRENGYARIKVSRLFIFSNYSNADEPTIPTRQRVAEILDEMEGTGELESVMQEAMGVSEKIPRELNLGGNKGFASFASMMTTDSAGGSEQSSFSDNIRARLAAEDDLADEVEDALRERRPDILEWRLDGSATKRELADRMFFASGEVLRRLATQK